MKKLHTNQKRLLDLLLKNQANPLSIREIQDILSLSSTSVVAHHLKQLERKGYMQRNPANPRDYKIITDPDNTDVGYVNVYGMAQCGPNGTLLDGNPIERIPFAKKLITFPLEQVFIVAAKGDSMQPKIKERDLVVAKMQSGADSGSVIVGVHNSKVLIKQYHITKEGIILTSYNPNYPPIRVVRDEDLIIEGVVKSVISYG
ncbi:HTH domain-containing protein [bacterium]|nr:HTH domain-containing protein [bacterium]